jgi:hypothetical protein
MSSSPPPPGLQPQAHGDVQRAPEGRKRPRYLVVALIAALMFGAGCWTEGCGRLAYYREAHERTPTMMIAIRDDADRARVEELFQRFVDAAARARGKALPLATATFVLGAALLSLATRGLGGRSNTRSALMQVVTVQAVVVVMSYFVTREMLQAEADWQYEAALVHQRERVSPEQLAEITPTLRSIQRWAPPAWLSLRTVASLLIVFALTRPRAREFFNATES